MKKSKLGVVTKHEFLNYFRSNLALVFLLIYLAASTIEFFYIGKFFRNNLADFSFFFIANTWIYALFIPAIAMRQIAEERRLGTFEYLVTLPIKPLEIVLGKFLGSLLFLTLSLFLLFPTVITVCILGDPDMGLLAAQIIGTLLIGGAYLAVSLFFSSMTNSPLIAFLLSAVACFFLNIAGSDMVLNVFAGQSEKALKLVKTFSFFEEARPFFLGVVSTKSVVFFASFAALFLFGTTLNVKEKR